MAKKSKIGVRERIKRWDAKVARAIRISREDADKTQKEVEGIMEWNRGVLSRIEKRGQSVGVGAFFVLCEELRVSPEEMLGRIKRW